MVVVFVVVVVIARLSEPPSLGRHEITQPLDHCAVGDVVLVAVATTATVADTITAVGVTRHDAVERHKLLGIRLFIRRNHRGAEAESVEVGP